MFSDYKRFFWLIYIIHGSSGHSMDAHFCMLKSSRCMHNEGIWLESKVGEHGVLTWQGRDAGDDPFTDDCDCEAATPNFRESVR